MGDILIEQLKKLKDIQPSNEWTDRTRNFLLAEINGDRYQEVDFNNNKRLGFLNSLKVIKLAWKPVGIFAMVGLLLLGGSGLTVIAAQNSVAGDSLFVIKKVIERSQDMVTANSAQKVELASVFLGNRVNELQRVIVRESELKSAYGEQKSSKVVLAVNEVKKQLNDVHQKFEALQSEENRNKENTAVAALALNDRIRSYKAELKEVKSKFNNQAIGAKIDEAIEQANTINGNVLDVIVNKYEAGELDLEDNKLAAKIEEHISDIEDKVNQATKVLADNEKSKEFKETAVRVMDKVEQAKVAVEDGEYSLGLTLSKDSNEILRILYGEINKVVKAQEEEEDKSINENNNLLKIEFKNIESQVLNQQVDNGAVSNTANIPFADDNNKTEPEEEIVGQPMVIGTEIEGEDDVQEPQGGFGVGIND